jgi:TonB family protein
MEMTKKFVYFVGLLMFFAINVFPQIKGQNSDLVAQNTKQNCEVFLTGKLLNNPQPIYPTEAKIAGIYGKVDIAVEIDESGNVTSIKNVAGNELLTKAASEAALQARFSPTFCNGTSSKNTGIITFNFPKFVISREYFKATKLNEFKDITEDSNYYEAVLSLTEKYRIAFGYADQKFHPEMPLIKGDFAHFLRQTLEMLEWRGKLAQKPIKEIGLYQSYNPHALNKIEVVPNSPFADSLNVLAEKYGIVLAEKDGSFAGDSPLTKTKVIEIWRNIFGEEALPVNFLNEKDNDKEMTRGDFAIYLKESLDVLTYKLLP